jgi:hypothetical protein
VTLISQECPPTFDEMRTDSCAGEVALRPLLKHEQRPELVRVIANHFSMLTNQLLDVLELKYPLLMKAC